MKKAIELDVDRETNGDRWNHTLLFRPENLLNETSFSEDGCLLAHAQSNSDNYFMERAK